MNAENKLKLFLLMQHPKETSEMWSSKGNKQWTVIGGTLWSDLSLLPHSQVEKWIKSVNLVSTNK